ncbi:MULTISPECIES: hypothetical protein [Nitratireductor]|jgi:hypothetical protein|uniref:Uncharacterized protein n=1 Tax=Nitratireductor basaltis TaxID=472175 RepID=A0A084U6Z9_9HYPH|nr:hypothetical protein [Nitratireductor basaltis]KFB08735.1 hypothetical protein EL18_02989 [Nitratireductor basaltis]
MIKAMKAGFGLTALAAVALFTGSQQATSEASVCAPRDDLVNQLGLQFNESQKAVGMLGAEAVMEVFTSSQGSWTILTTDVNGNSCIMAAGEGWDDNFSTLVGQGV